MRMAQDSRSARRAEGVCRYHPGRRDYTRRACFASHRGVLEAGQSPAGVFHNARNGERDTALLELAGCSDLRQRRPRLIWSARTRPFSDDWGGFLLYQPYLLPYVSWQKIVVRFNNRGSNFSHTRAQIPKLRACLWVLLYLAVGEDSKSF